MASLPVRTVRHRRLSVQPWWLLLLAILPIVTFLAHFRGHMVLGWDSTFQLNPLQYLEQSLSGWNWREELGQSNVLQITQAPAALVALLLSLPFGTIVGQKIELAILFVLPAFTMYYCARRAFKTEPAVWFAAGLAYALCPLLLSRLYIPLVNVELVYALTPLIVNAWIDLIAGGARGRALLWVAGVELAFLPAANNLAYWIVPHATAFLYALALTATTPSARPRRWRALRDGLLVVVLINGFWLVPQLAFGLADGSTVAHRTLNQAYTTGVRSDVAEQGQLSYVLRMGSRAQIDAGDANGPFWTYAGWLAKGVVAAPFFLWILLVALALALRRKDRRVVILGVLLLFALYVMKGTSPPLAQGLQAFYRIPLLGAIFRNGFDKLLPMAAFAFSLLVPLAAIAVGRSMGRTRVALGVVIVAILLLAFPLWTGQMYMVRPHGPSLSTLPPANAFAFARRLDRLHSRVLFAPLSANPLLLATTWGFYGPNVYYYMTKAPFIPMSSATLDRPGTDAVTTAIYQAIDDGDVKTFESLTKSTDIGYVFVSHDMNSAYYGGDTAEAVDTFLAKLPGTRVDDIVGPYTLWRLRYVPVPMHVRSVRQVAGYGTDLLTALALAPRCNVGPVALVAGAQAPCDITTPFATSSAATAPAPVAAARGRVADGRVTIALDAAPSPIVLPVPASTALAWIGDNVLTATPSSMIGLMPCAQYRVVPFGVRGAVAPVPFVNVAPQPSPNNLLFALPVVPGQDVVRVRAPRTEPGVTVAVWDPLSNEPVTQRTLTGPATALLFYALPGHRYELSFTGSVPFGSVLTAVSSAAIAPVGRTAMSHFAMPPSSALARCMPEPQAVAVRDAPVRASVAVDGRDLLVYAPSMEPPFDLASIPLPRAADFVRFGDALAGRSALAVTIAPGTTQRLRVYRAIGRPRAVALRHTFWSQAMQTPLEGDPTRGQVTLEATGSAWFHTDLVVPRGGGEYALGVDVSRLTGSYSIGIVDAATLALVGQARGLHEPRVAVAFHAQSGEKYIAFLYLDPSPEASTAAARVTGIDLTPIQPAGYTTLSLKRIVPTVTGDPFAAVVRRDAARPVRHVVVLNTQYDAFWEGMNVQSRPPFLRFPKHVVVDGWKNGWLLPTESAGRFVTFYLTDAMTLAGLVVALLTLVVLARAARRSRQA